ncbi:hypothetical protein [Prochlorococcus marinus]|uniref:hypothetical protein n=1 Tax=Prochlorococcus marinus TaxID=1219 RepID=UPI0022B5DEC0|nr:hypothetical protein [Prochlorococcus marinus]
MPSIRKRIGYLPSVDAQEKITKIANKEKLSQSKVVGILVQEALIGRGEIDPNNTNILIRKSLQRKKNNIDNSTLTYNEIDELISDEGIVYIRKNHKDKTEHNLSESREINNEELFEHFKQFMLFQKTIKEKL